MKCPDSAAAIAKHVLDGKKFTRSLYVDFCGCVVEIRSNTSEVIRRLADYYRPFVVKKQAAAICVTAIQRQRLSPDFAWVEHTRPKGKQLKELFFDFDDGRAVRKFRTGMMMVMTRDVNLAAGPCLGNMNQVVNFINNRHIERLLNQGGVLLHCAGVVVERQGLAICGFSGMGKSTLALHLMRQGADFVSNDRLIVHKNRRAPVMHGVAKHPRVNPGTIIHDPMLEGLLSSRRASELRRMNAHELWDLEQKYDVLIDKVYGPGRFHLKSPLNALVILNWSRRTRQPTQMRQVDLSRRRDLFPAFVKDPGVFFQPRHERFYQEFTTDEAYADHLKNCRVYEIFGKADFDQAGALCLELFQKTK